ncbi:hypothetical protein AB0A76_12525 [Streptomyces exfoliatus]|uniref:Uncharacterized protein n=1 Tax=Streptomyces exfoliatus TaxID=1905 RepID=A0ABV3CUW6_STREX
MPGDVRARVTGRDDPETLRRWLALAVTAASAEDIFAEEYCQRGVRKGPGDDVRSRLSRVARPRSAGGSPARFGALPIISPT